MNDAVLKIENYTSICGCRLCGGELDSALNFGRTPLANSYPKTPQEDEYVYPLHVMRCKECGHIQLRDTVKPEILFSNYLYSSSDSPALVQHFEKYARDVTKFLEVKKDDNILEIGSNDGVLLRALGDIGYRRLIGVEPATNLYAKSFSSVATIFPTFFDELVANDILGSIGAMKLICANNVFAHVDKLKSMVTGIRNLLAGDGVFVFENAYLLDTIRKMYFDQIYHEHLQYYGVKPLREFFRKRGLEIFRVEFSDIQGGSFRIFVQHKGGNRLVDRTVGDAIDLEDSYGLYHPQTYINFAVRLKHLKQKMTKIQDRAALECKSFCCYGCPAKFTLFSAFFDLGQARYVVDDSPLKQGRFSPGLKIPIVSNQHFKESPADYCVIAAWNMAKPIMEKNAWYREKGKFIVPMPVPTIVE
jgi:hypothetical protein